MRRLTVATTNTGKLREMAAALAGLSQWTVSALPEGSTGIEETGNTFHENAALKARHYSLACEGWTLADDSGLCVDALGGAPGIYSDRYGPNPEARNARVLSELAALDKPDRRAYFACAFVIAQNGTEVWHAETALEGQIARAPEGNFGFGYDPIFLVPGLGKTLAQLSLEEKNRVSARGQALIRLREFLQSW